MQRRDLFVVGGAAAVAIALPSILRRLPSSFEFQPHGRLPGFRVLRGGSTSSVNVALIGLDGMAEPAGPPAALPVDPCDALFGPEGWNGNQVPVAVFSDFNCPYCKTLDARLVDLRDNEGSIRLVWHELPLLGPQSLRAAEAVIAAGFLGAGDAARTYLWHRNLRPGPVALRQMAEELGVDAQALLAEAASPRVAQKLSQGLALGRLLGIPGTPGTLVGRTLVIGTIRQPDLKRLIRLEQEATPAACV